MSYFLMFVKLMVSQIVLANELFLANNGFYGTAHEYSNFTPLQQKSNKKRNFQGLMINLCVILLGSKTHVVSNKSIVFQF